MLYLHKSQLLTSETLTVTPAHAIYNTTTPRVADTPAQTLVILHNQRIHKAFDTEHR